MKLHQQYHFRDSESGLLAWDVLKLIELSNNFAIIHVPLQEITELNENYWFSLGELPISKNIAAHAKQIYESDLSYPIILCPQGRIMDGMHRACKALIEDKTTIAAVKFTELPPPDHIGKQPEELDYEKSLNI